MQRRSSALSPISSLLLSLIAIASIAATANAAFVQPRYAVNLRPRSQENAERSSLEAMALRKRQAIPSCGDASGKIVDVKDLVDISVAEGLPSASDAGVVFMEAVIASTEACGPYSCFVSSDASGTSWANMLMLQNVPTVEEGCTTTEGSNTQTLVASFPQGISCTGTSGACLVMCKAPNMPLGNCAAVAWSPDAAALTTPYTSTTSETPTPVATITSIIDKTHTTTRTTSPRQDRVPSSVISSTTTLSSLSRAAPTLQGFSGDNGPGGRSEQLLNFGLSITSEEMNSTSTSAATIAYSSKLGTSLAISAAFLYLIT